MPNVAVFPQQTMRAQLTVVEGPDVGRAFTLPPEGRVVLGRTTACDFHLPHEGLSRTHCAVRSLDGEFTVSDLNSTNGTLVNGAKISTRRLEPGDLIRIGPIVLRFDPISPGHAGTRSTVFTVVDDRAPLDISRREPVESVHPLPHQTGTFPPKSRERDLAALYRVTHEISRVDDPGRLFNALIDAVLEVTGATRGAVLLPGVDGIEIAAARGAGVRADAPLTISRTIAAETLQKGHSVLSGNAMADDRFGAGQSVILQKLRSVLCVPIESHEKVLGAIYLDSAGMVEAFGEVHLELVAAVGRQAGIALQRLRLIRDLENRVFGTVRSLVAALEAKDRYTRGHSERVGAFALRIAHALDVPHNLWADIRLAGVLHDIGKIGIPEPILNKPAKLTDEEYALVQNHSVAGGRILEGIAGFETVRDGVRLHHERWDGKGYPEGRKGDATPLVARIVGIADAYDTMAYKRVYREAIPKEGIASEIRRCAGTQFDPAVAEAVCRLIEEERLTSPQLLSVEVASRVIADRGQELGTDTNYA